MRHSLLSLTPCFSGVFGAAWTVEPLQRFSCALETVETVHPSGIASNTPLKQGVNENQSRRSPARCGILRST